MLKILVFVYLNGILIFLPSLGARSPCFACVTASLREWSHTALDFVTGIPPSISNTMILTVVDCFSMGAHFIPLPKLLSVKEMARVCRF